MPWALWSGCSNRLPARAGVSFPASCQIGEVVAERAWEFPQGAVLQDHDPVCQAVQEVLCDTIRMAPANLNRTSSRISADWMSWSWSVRPRPGSWVTEASSGPSATGSVRHPTTPPRDPGTGGSRVGFLQEGNGGGLGHGHGAGIRRQLFRYPCSSSPRVGDATVSGLGWDGIRPRCVGVQPQEVEEVSPLHAGRIPKPQTGGNRMRAPTRQDPITSPSPRPSCRPAGPPRR